MKKGLKKKEAILGPIIPLLHVSQIIYPQVSAYLEIASTIGGTIFLDQSHKYIPEIKF